MLNSPAHRLEEERKRLTALRFQLLESHPFWGYLLLQMKVIFQDDLPSFAATDCYKTIWLNPTMTSLLSIRQLGFVLLHEICHSVFASMARRHGRNRHLWNCATDYAINRIIMEIPKPGFSRGNPLYELPDVMVGKHRFYPLYETRFEGMVAEVIYEQLALEELEKPSIIVLKLDGMPQDADGDNGIELPNIMDHHGGIDVHIPVDLTSDQREELIDRIRCALETWQKADGRGSIPCDSICELLPGKKSRVPWARMLRQFAGQALAKDDYSMCRPNRCYLSEQIVVPGMYSETLNLVVIALDTSGSMDVETLSLAMAEISKLGDLVSEVVLLVGDCEIHEVVPTSRLPEYVKGLKVRGGGGTSHRPVFEYIAEKRLEPDLFIGLTDLDSIFPDRAPSFPVLWVVPESHEDAPWGRVIEINE